MLNTLPSLYLTSYVKYTAFAVFNLSEHHVSTISLYQIFCHALIESIMATALCTPELHLQLTFRLSGLSRTPRTMRQTGSNNECSATL